MKLIKKVFTGEIKGVDEKEMTLTAYISTGAKDRHNESVDPMGADFSNYKRNPVVLWAHDYEKPPIGKALWIKREGEGIVSKVKFANTEFAQEIFQLYKEGFLKAFSIGFIPDMKSVEDGDGEKQPRRTYRKWEMLEYSAVPVPANPEALALAIQKGILKTDSIRESMEVSDEDRCDNDLTKESKEAKSSSGMDELMLEIEMLQEEIFALGKENADLRYRVFELLKERKELLLEKAGSDLETKIIEIVDGAFRKLTGKVS